MESNKNKKIQTKKLETCIICDEVLNRSQHMPISCLHCNQVACRICCKEYLLTTREPACMFPNCKKPWTRKFCAQSFTKQFMLTTYRELRETRLFGYEQSLLPATQILVEEYNRSFELLEQSIVIHKGYLENLTENHKQLRVTLIINKRNEYDINYAHIKIKKQIEMEIQEDKKKNEQNDKDNKKEIQENKKKIKKMRIEEREYNLMNKRNHANNRELQMKITVINNANKDIIYKIKTLKSRQNGLLYHLNQGIREFLNPNKQLRAVNLLNNEEDEIDELGEVKSKKARVFVRACPNNDCRGFLSSHWKCGLCELYTCSKCHVLKGTHINKENDDHTCNPDDVLTATLLKKDSKPCPKCAAQIFKISGCDQMWCTICSTAFSWKTGLLITNGIIHNPHYYEWMRRTGVTERNPLEIRCGRELNYTFLREVRNNINRMFEVNDRSCIYERVSNMVQSVLHVQELARNMHPNAVENNFVERFAYLKNKISLTVFKKNIQRLNKRFDLNREKRDILNTFVQTATDILYDYSDNVMLLTKLNELDQFIVYINTECFSELKTIYGTPSLYNIVLRGSPENARIKNTQHNNVLININHIS